MPFSSCIGDDLQRCVMASVRDLKTALIAKVILTLFLAWNVMLQLDMVENRAL